MYMDKYQTFALGTDAAQATTKELPISQPDVANQLYPNTGMTAPRDTTGMGPYCQNLWVYVGAAEAVPAGFTLDMETADQSTADGGTFEPIATFGPTTEAKVAGDTLLKFPVPKDVKAWVRFTQGGTPVKLNIFYTPDVTFNFNGLRTGD